MLITATLTVALLLTLIVPLYPSGLDASILAFLGVASLAGLFAMSRRVARRELLVLSFWATGLGVAAFVGGLDHGDARQIVEDILPYGLFTLGLVAGRAAHRPRVVLFLVLVLCVAESSLSLIKLAPVYSPGYRSTWVYGRIVTGVSVLGIFVLMFLRRLDATAGAGARRSRSPVIAFLYVVMLLATIGSGSRGMTLGLAIGVGTVAYIQRPSRALLATVVVGLAYVAYDSVLADVGVRYLRAGQVATVEGRLDEVRTSLVLFAEHPLFGCGLGTKIVVEGTHKAYVHNIIAYHLWKFGLVGSFILTVPLLLVGAQIRRYPRKVSAVALGGATAMFAYLVTCAGYKVYYVVWLLGVTAGAVLSALWEWSQRAQREPAP